MTRHWVDDLKKKPIDKRWVMQCDVGWVDGSKVRCQTTSEPSVAQPSLDQFAAAGWHIDDKWPDDICPPCLAAGVKPKREATRHPRHDLAG